MNIPLLLFYFGMAYALMLLGYLLGRRDRYLNNSTSHDSVSGAIDTLSHQLGMPPRERDWNVVGRVRDELADHIK